MTPEERNETLDIFEEVRSQQVKQLVDLVLKADYTSAREIAKKIVKGDALLCEITKESLANPAFTKRAAVDMAREHMRASLQGSPAPTAWERILKEVE